MTGWIIVYFAGTAVTSLAGGLVVAAVASWLFRLGGSRWEPWVLSLPFAKVAFDVWNSFATVPYGLSPSGSALWDQGKLMLAGPERLRSAQALSENESAGC